MSNIKEKLELAFKKKYLTDFKIIIDIKKTKKKEIINVNSFVLGTFSKFFHDLFDFRKKNNINSNEITFTIKENNLPLFIKTIESIYGSEINYQEYNDYQKIKLLSYSHKLGLEINEKILDQIKITDDLCFDSYINIFQKLNLEINNHALTIIKNYENLENKLSNFHSSVLEELLKINKYNLIEIGTMFINIFSMESSKMEIEKKIFNFPEINFSSKIDIENNIYKIEKTNNINNILVYGKTNILLINWIENEQIFSINHASKIIKVKFFSENSCVYFSDIESNLNIYNTDTQSLIESRKMENIITDIVFVDNNIVIVSDIVGTITMLKNLNIIYHFGNAHNDRIHKLLFNYNDNILFSSSSDKKINSYFVHLNQNIIEKNKTINVSSSAISMDLNSNGNMLISGHNNGDINIWSTSENFNKLKTISNTYKIHNTYFSFCDDWIFYNEYKNTIKCYHLLTNKIFKLSTTNNMKPTNFIILNNYEKTNMRIKKEIDKKYANN